MKTRVTFDLVLILNCNLTRTSKITSRTARLIMLSKVSKRSTLILDQTYLRLNFAGASIARDVQPVSPKVDFSPRIKTTFALPVTKAILVPNAPNVTLLSKARS